MICMGWKRVFEKHTNGKTEIGKANNLGRNGKRWEKQTNWRERMEDEVTRQRETKGGTEKRNEEQTKRRAKGNERRERGRKEQKEGERMRGESTG